MTTSREIHLLSQELIPVLNELDAESKQVVLDHIDHCEACQNLYTNANEFDEQFLEADASSDVEIKPFKRLARFNTGLKLFFIGVRGLILFYILYSAIRFWDTLANVIPIIQANVYLLYLPAAVFLLVFTIAFLNRKWVGVTLLADIIIVVLTLLLRLFL